MWQNTRETSCRGCLPRFVPYSQTKYSKSFVNSVLQQVPNFIIIALKDFLYIDLNLCLVHDFVSADASFICKNVPLSIQVLYTIKSLQIENPVCLN